MSVSNALVIKAAMEMTDQELIKFILHIVKSKDSVSLAKELLAYLDMYIDTKKKEMFGSETIVKQDTGLLSDVIIRDPKDIRQLTEEEKKELKERANDQSFFQIQEEEDEDAEDEIQGVYIGTKASKTT